MSSVWIQTFTGRRFDLLDPQPEMVDIDDIAHALSMLCRFTGHTGKFYSVAQHSVLVSSLVPIGDALVGLMHDATEAYVGDLSSPLKALLPEYKRIERGIWLAIADKFSLPPIIPQTVRDADIMALMTERDDLLGVPPEPWGGNLEGAPRAAKPLFSMSQWGARDRFYAEFNRLTRALAA